MWHTIHFRQLKVYLCSVTFGSLLYGHPVLLNWNYQKIFSAFEGYIGQWIGSKLRKMSKNCCTLVEI